MIEFDELVTEAVQIPPKPTLPWQHVVIVVDVFIEERSVLKLLRCEELM